MIYFAKRLDHFGVAGEVDSWVVKRLNFGHNKGDQYG